MPQIPTPEQLQALAQAQGVVLPNAAEVVAAMQEYQQWFAANPGAGGDGDEAEEEEDLVDEEDADMWDEEEDAEDELHEVCVGCGWVECRGVSWVGGDIVQPSPTTGR